MIIERTTDLALVRSVIFHPGVADEFGACEEIMVLHKSIYWLTVRVGGTVAGMLMFLPLYGMAWNPHIAILPEFRGRGTEAMRRSVAWMFENSPAEKILAFPFKQIMIRVYEKCGFVVEGRSTKLVRKDGELLDCVIVALNKGPSC